jgi:hypothetical protein
MFSGFIIQLIPEKETAYLDTWFLADIHPYLLQTYVGVLSLFQTDDQFTLDYPLADRKVIDEDNYCLHLQG